MHTAFSTGHSLHRSVAQSGSSIQRNLVSCLTCAAFHSSEPNTYDGVLAAVQAQCSNDLGHSLLLLLC